MRNVEMMWLTGRLAPDFKTIADFRKDNGPAKQAQAATGVRALIAIARSRLLQGRGRVDAGLEASMDDGSVFCGPSGARACPKGGG
jgi:hypothetical protein